MHSSRCSAFRLQAQAVVGINWLNLDLSTQELKLEKAMFFLIFQVHEDIQNTFISFQETAKMALLSSVV